MTLYRFAQTYGIVVVGARFRQVPLADLTWESWCD